MACSGASTSGRLLESSGSGGKWQVFLMHTAGLSTRRVPLHSGSSTQRALRCQALASPTRLHLPLLKAVQRLFRPSQDAPIYVEVTRQAENEDNSAKAPLSSLFRQATYAAIDAGLKLTGVAMRIARTVLDDFKRSVRLLQVHQEVQRKATAARKLLDAETLLQFEAEKATLRLQGRDAGFVKMLHVLDRSHLDHEAKWALVQKHTADKADFSERLQHLYKAASDSKEAVETLLRPDASRAEINSFWKSEQTAALIAEEESLKRLVFAQMLESTTA